MINLTLNMFRNLLRKPATRRYPAEKRPPFEGARGRLDNRIADCVFCGACQKRCPADALTVSRDPKSWTLDPYRCIVCGYCVDVCPKKCLFMAPEHRAPARS